MWWLTQNISDLKYSLSPGSQGIYNSGSECYFVLQDISTPGGLVPSPYTMAEPPVTCEHGGLAPPPYIMGDLK